MNTRPIRFVRRGELVTLGNVSPDRTLLEVLREDLGCTGTKEGCGEGDCGACTVVLGEAEGDRVSYKAVNSCIRMAHSVDGLAVWTVEDLAQDDGRLHPAQQAMVDCHGSQCGFCTPGFVMSLFGMYNNKVCQGRTISREEARHDLSGNLCRCTGYRPILDAAEQMATLPAVRIDEPALLEQLRQIAPQHADDGYLAPTTLATLLQARAEHPGAQIVAGTTDVGLWITKLHRQYDTVLDVTRAAELRRVERYPHHIAIGAAVTLHEAFEALVADRPQLATFAARFAGLPVRNSGTLGGNVANGSPIGDSMPLLIALGAHVVLMSMRRGKMASRELPLEQLYTGYRQNVMAPDELLAWIKVPLPAKDESSAARAAASVGAEFLRAYKISKRYDDDISAVCLAVRLHLEDGVVRQASIGAGGVAATPVRATQAEAVLVGQPWTEAAARAAGAALQAQFQPISDMRASAAYRRQLLANLMQRLWLESQGATRINLESFVLEDSE